MTVKQLRPGDRLEVEIRGQKFEALFKELEETPFGRRVWIEPLSRRFSYRAAWPHQVVRRIARAAPPQQELRDMSAVATGEGGRLEVAPARDGSGVVLSLYGARGGFVAGASLGVGVAKSFAAAIAAAEEEALLEPVQREEPTYTAVPWLGTH